LTKKESYEIQQDLNNFNSNYKCDNLEKLDKKINTYTIKFLNNICQELDDKYKNENLYINTNEALFSVDEKRKKNNSSKKNSPKKSLTKSPGKNSNFNSNENRNKTQSKILLNENVHPYVHQNVIRIQRAFKKFYLEKKSLPENFFFTQKILEVLYEKKNKNFEDNYRILFPSSDRNDNFDYNNTIDDNNKNKFNSNLTKENSLISNLIHNPYEDGKIHLFAKILDIDVIVCMSIYL